MIDLNPSRLWLLWVVTLLFLLLKIIGLFHKRLCAYFNAHPKLWNGIDGWLFVLVLLLAEQYMAWWWAAALSLGCTIFFSILMGRKKK